MRQFGLLSVVLLLSACGSSPNLQPPRELQPIDKPLRIDTVWSGQAGRGAGEQYLQLPVRHHGDMAYAADYQGYVKAFALDSGKAHWERQTGLQLATGAAYHNGRLYFGTRQGEVVALSAEDGRELWRSELSSEVIARPAVADEILVAKTHDGKLFALETAGGERRWVYDRSVPALTLRGNSAPIIVNDLVIAGFDNGRLTALVLNNGSIFWETAISHPSGKTELERMIDIDADPVVVDDVVYAVTYQGRLAAVDIRSGRIQWARDMSSYTGMVADDYRIYLSDSEGQVLALNRRNGATLWRQDKLLRRDLTRPQLDGPYLVVADYDGYLHWLLRESGRLKGRARINAGFYLFTDEYDGYELAFRKENNVLTPPLVTDERVIAVDRHGSLDAFRRIE
ncbi:outer membrane protein assembly factor BamB [Thiohalophilus sp.]|uniref:outer membrane protein assembly factor BamB n=1 Tax=Thiohalophilus sp. TaxID=3028392 RepID=UPI002ACE2006|nr:outer membrane protein assembly factor BamB [Thiohalophilus sp.]MDZ7663389.1 outer membrane protein assembly factor BamB [Thiohalophilus sp.]